MLEECAKIERVKQRKTARMETKELAAAQSSMRKSGSSFWKSTFCILLAVSVILCLGFFSDTRAPHLTHKRRLLDRTGDDGFIRLACRATLYPEVCVSSISADPRSKNGFSSPAQLIQLSVDLASQATSQSFNLTSGILKQAGGNRNLTAATRDCVQVLGFAITRYKQCKASFSSGSPPVKDLEAWLSGILAFQYDCFSALGYVNSSKVVQNTMIQVHSGTLLISNALAMTNALDNYGADVSKWKPPPTKRQSGTVKNMGWTRKRNDHFKKFRISAIVAKDGSSDFQSVQQAINSAPDYSQQRYVIHIKEGVYNERVFVPETKTMITLVGDGIDKTIITGSDYVRDGVTTMETSTMLVAGDGFVAQHLTIRNTAGPELHQAVALRIDSDKVTLRSCSLVGFQDTLYSHVFRHYFDNCTIYGTVDFIFGNAAAVFSNCKMLVRPGRKGIYTSMVTAQGRIDPAQTTGFAFHNCTIDSSPEVDATLAKQLKAFLGRPWKEYARVIYLNTYMGSIVPPEGWLPWKGDFALQTLLFGEYASHGPGGSDVSNRVTWSSQLTSSQVPLYSVHNFIQGDQWIPRS